MVIKRSFGNGVPAMARHLTMVERDRIAQLCGSGQTGEETARRLGRHRSTIYRELKRNGTGGEYLAAQAQRQAERRRRERPLVRKTDRPAVNQVVLHLNRNKEA